MGKRLAISDQFSAPEGRRNIAQGERSEPWGEGARVPQAPAPQGGDGSARNPQGAPLTGVPLAACLPVHHRNDRSIDAPMFSGGSKTRVSVRSRRVARTRYRLGGASTVRVDPTNSL